MELLRNYIYTTAAVTDSDFTPSPRHLCLIHALGFKVLTATNIVATETELLVCGNN